MKKMIIIGCLSLSGLILLISIACSVISYQSATKYLSKNSDIVREIIGGEIPEGYYPIVAEKKLAKPNDTTSTFIFSVLANPEGHTIVLISGSPIKTEQQRNKFIKSFEQGMQYNNTSEEKNLTIIPDEKLIINKKSFPKYKISIIDNKSSVKGFGALIDYPQKTLFFAYLAPEARYNEDTGISFLKRIRLPD